MGRRGGATLVLKKPKCDGEKEGEEHAMGNLPLKMQGDGLEDQSLGQTRKRDTGNP